MSERLNTQDLVDLLVKRQGLDKKEAENFIKEFFFLIEEGLEKDKSVKIKGLGTFKLVDVESRESVNVNTGERIEIQGHTKISFTPDPALRDIINRPFAHFETVILNDLGDDELGETPLDEEEEEEESVPEIVKIKEVVKTIKEEKEDEVVAVVVPEPEKIAIEPEKVLTETQITAIEKEEIPEAHEMIVNDHTPPPAEPKKKIEQESTNKVLILVIILTILLCGLLLFFTYDAFSIKDKPAQTPKVPVENKTVIDSTTIVNDSIEEVKVKEEPKKVETPSAKPVNTGTERKHTIPFSKIPVHADWTSYTIVGTKAHHTVRNGETLIRIAYKYYGTKDLYPYLIMHNQSIIRDPNNVPVGMTISIPELRKK